MPAGQLNLFEFFTLSRIVSVVLVMAATWLLLRYLTSLLHAASARTPRARFFIKWAEPILRISLWFVALLICFDLIAPTRETFLAAVGSAAIAVGLGAQDLIKNLVGGLVILTDRPYQLGDRVKMGEAYGEIDHIGLRSTKLTTPDDTRVTIPNADILSTQVFNANSGVPDCQVVTDVFLPHDSDPVEAQQVGYEAAYTCPFLHVAKPVVVLISDVLDQRLYTRVRVKAYVYDHRFEPAMQSDITVRCKTEFHRRGMLGAAAELEPKPN
ncbi:MAG: mechanosensitive ion channel family protein [Bryobacteraceae bacterium]